ncbi:MAG: hypothetical protein AB7U24_06630 [Sulfurimonadaceae bacterium]
MNLEQLRNKTVVLLGKSRTFAMDEFEEQLRLHAITLACDTQDFREPPALIIEGKMMSPYQQIQSEELYEKKVAPFVSIDVLEELLARNIHEESLLMALKLSRDKERLLAFLKNRALSDSLFLRLLGLYDFRGEDFFENDANRDVSAAFIERFYKNIERNHNVQYATLGLVHLVAQTSDPLLLQTLVQLEPLRKALKSEDKSANLSILLSIASHPAASEDILALFVKNGSLPLQKIVAMREDCPERLQNKLYETNEREIWESLSKNPALSFALAQKLAGEYGMYIAAHRVLDEAFFELLFGAFAPSLACNPTLGVQMQLRLFERGEPVVDYALASNGAIESALWEKLLAKGDARVAEALYANKRAPQEKLLEARTKEHLHKALACNPASPKQLLQELSHSQNPEVLQALAQNENTPVEVLYQLGLDSRLERFVKENKSFGKHIQTHNIGWMV